MSMTAHTPITSPSLRWITLLAVLFAAGAALRGFVGLWLVVGMFFGWLGVFAPCLSPSAWAQVQPGSMGALQDRLRQAPSQPLSWPAAQVGQAGARSDTAGLERSWQELDQQLRALDGLIPAEPGLNTRDLRALPPVPQLLLDANAPASVQLSPAKLVPAAPLVLPGPSSLEAGPVQSMTLEQALAIAFANSATLQAQREQVAASAAQLRATQGLYWPTLSAIVSGSSGQSSSSLYAPVGNTGLGFGPNFALPSGAFAVPTGGGAYLNTYSTSGGAGLQLTYALLDFTRNPSVQGAQAQLDSARNTYASQLRSLQLQVSEAYFQLQQADQTVRINQATLANDLVILAESLDLQRAGLVPRLNGLRRSAISASDQDTLIQSLADRAVARRQLAVLLNLPPQITPAARDPIRPLARWPLNLEQSLLAAYRGNPELETILATREALLRQRDGSCRSCAGAYRAGGGPGPTGLLFAWLRASHRHPPPWLSGIVSFGAAAPACPASMLACLLLLSGLALTSSKDVLSSGTIDAAGAVANASAAQAEKGAGAAGGWARGVAAAT
jgi:outer membrane protein TolC